MSYIQCEMLYKSANTTIIKWGTSLFQSGILLNKYEMKIVTLNVNLAQQWSICYSQKSECRVLDTNYNKSTLLNTSQRTLKAVSGNVKCLRDISSSMSPITWAVHLCPSRWATQNSFSLLTDAWSWSCRWLTSVSSIVVFSMTPGYH